MTRDGVVTKVMPRYKFTICNFFAEDARGLRLESEAEKVLQAVASDSGVGQRVGHFEEN